MHLRRAIELALEAETKGNLPIGSVISFHGRLVAEGKNTIWVPEFNPLQHAEMEALIKVVRGLFEISRKITLYTILEPCLMCTAAILQHGVGRFLYGATDSYGCGSCIFGHMSPYFETELANVQWLGPAFAGECASLIKRAMQAVKQH